LPPDSSCAEPPSPEPARPLPARTAMLLAACTSAGIHPHRPEFRQVVVLPPPRRLPGLPTRPPFRFDSRSKGRAATMPFHNRCMRHKAVTITSSNLALKDQMTPSPILPFASGWASTSESTSFELMNRSIFWPTTCILSVAGFVTGIGDCRSPKLDATREH